VRAEWIAQHAQARAVVAIRQTRNAASKAAAEARFGFLFVFVLFKRVLMMILFFGVCV
jgi:hypothetical protein